MKTQAPSSHAPDISILLPYYNEAEYLPATLASLISQACAPARLILVDNASSDGSQAVCRDALAHRPGIDALHLHEPRAGKVHALETGLAAVETPFVATCDADTYYPPHYLARARALFGEDPRVAAVMAVGVSGDPESLAARFARRKAQLVSKLLARQCHTGGYGQVFRTGALRAAGGFSWAQWPYVLEDHEIMQRVFRHGVARYHPDLWCAPSDRRADRSSVDWTLFERIAYHLTPFALKDRYFHSFLARRLQRRGLTSLNLREKTWEDA